MWNALLVLSVLGPMNVRAQPEIHRCLQADGTIAFQEMPCPETEPADSAAVGNKDVQSDSEGIGSTEEFFDFVNPYDQKDEASETSKPEPEAPVSQDRATCEKSTRDAIDVIDVEMRKGYTKEQGQRYLAELLGLTKQLRACKQL